MQDAADFDGNRYIKLLFTRIRDILEMHQARFLSMEPRVTGPPPSAGAAFPLELLESAGWSAIGFAQAKAGQARRRCR